MISGVSGVSIQAGEGGAIGTTMLGFRPKNACVSARYGLGVPGQGVGEMGRKIHENTLGKGVFSLALKNRRFFWVPFGFWWRWMQPPMP